MVTTDGHRLEGRVKVAGRQALPRCSFRSRPSRSFAAFATRCLRKGPRRRTTGRGKPRASHHAERRIGVLPGRRRPVQREALSMRSFRRIRRSFRRTVRSSGPLRLAGCPSRRLRGRVERTGGVKLADQRHSMRITSSRPESGDGSDEIPIEYAGPNMSHRLQREVLPGRAGGDPDDEVAVGLSGELDPAVLRPAGATTTSDRQFLSVVMPMRI